MDFNLPSTYGVARMAGTVNPTPTRNRAHVQKFGANAVAIPKTVSMMRYIKNAGFLPALS